METVRTSDVLESQILDDARAKAARILDAADKECAAVRAEWDRRGSDEIQRLEAVRAARIAGLRQDLEASLPLDFLRSRLGFFEKSVSAALAGFFAALDEQGLSRLVGGQLAKASFAFVNQHLVVWTAGISDDAARKIVTASIPGAVVQELKPLPAEAAAETGIGLIVETTDGSRRFRATLQELTALLLEEHREELVKALFGKDVKT